MNLMLVGSNEFLFVDGTLHDIFICRSVFV